MKTMLQIMLGVYIGVLIKQRYRLPRVVTPEEMWEKVKEAERQQRVDYPDDKDEEGSRSKRRERRGWSRHCERQTITDVEQKKAEEQMKEVVNRLKNLEQMFRQEQTQPQTS